MFGKLQIDPMDIDMEQTPICTPTEQTSFWPEAPQCGRTTSVTSIASSINSFSNNNEFNFQSFAANYKLTEAFEGLLMKVFNSYLMNPTITPFSETNPPSGILNKVSKESIKLAQEQGVEIGIDINNYSLTIIRQKLMQLCRRGSGSSISYTQPNTRNNSTTSLNTFPSVNLSSKFCGTPGASSSRAEPVSYFNYDPWQQQQQQQPFAQQLQPQQQLQEPMPVQLQRTESTTSSDGLFNATSNRKRESLRLKRTGSVVAYN